MKKLYAPNKEYKAGFPTLDNNGWYKEVSDEEFNVLLGSKKITLENGIYILDDYDYTGSQGIYSNPGIVLKGIATAIFIVGLIISVVAAIYVGKLSYDFNFTLFVIIAIAGALISYISGLGLAALGDLVINVKAIRVHLTK